LDGSRFDLWTRRRFGLTTGGAALAGLLGVLGLGEDDEADAARRHRNNQNNNNQNNGRRRRRRRPKRCRNLNQSCDSSVRRLSCCNSNQLCANVPALGSGTFCCVQNGDFCDSSDDCCGNDFCDFSTGRCRRQR
jgi:hypothetical protein